MKTTRTPIGLLPNPPAPRPRPWDPTGAHSLRPPSASGAIRGMFPRLGVGLPDPQHAQTSPHPKGNGALPHADPKAPKVLSAPGPPNASRCQETRTTGPRPSCSPTPSNCPQSRPYLEGSHEPPEPPRPDSCRSSTSCSAQSSPRNRGSSPERPEGPCAYGRRQPGPQLPRARIWYPPPERPASRSTFWAHPVPAPAPCSQQPGRPPFKSEGRQGQTQNIAVEHCCQAQQE